MVKPRLVIVVATGGGFDPIHIGHLNLLEEAKTLGDHLQVWLCTDEWLIRKKGYYILPYEHRKAVLEALPFVDEVVVQIDDGTQSCAAAIRIYKPDILAKGGTYHLGMIPQEEKDACKEVGCDIMFGVGGHLKEGSSTDFFKKAIEKLWESKPK
ncbi:Bifunctional protein HldE [subsurface metagenome]